MGRGRGLPADEWASSCALVLTPHGLLYLGPSRLDLQTPDCSSPGHFLKWVCGGGGGRQTYLNLCLIRFLEGALQSSSGHLLLEVTFRLPEPSLSIGMESICTTSPWGNVPTLSKWIISKEKQNGL